MGDEIPSNHFNSSDLKEFIKRLHNETKIVHDWLAQNRFSNQPKMFGYELEAWLIDSQHCPAPINEYFLEALNNPLVVPELASFNFELNSFPQRLSGGVFRQMEQNLTQICNQCRHQAQLLGSDILTIGILPSIMEADLSLKNISNSTRYRALNEQIFRLRNGRPLKIDIKGHEHFLTHHNDVMLEAATTSLQIHVQVPSNLATRYYNAAIILSGPMAAATGNSPYLFGKHLWEETRVPLFEQAVSVSDNEDDLKRVSFGTGYAKDSLMECFQENCDHFPVILPVLFNEPPEKLAHLRLHNGTIWRWNRPLIGFNNEGEPHLRIEHRVISAGPSIIDTVANAALFIGAIKYLTDEITPPEQNLSFSQARDNFYAGAKHGLQARFHWFDAINLDAQTFLLAYLLPLARNGLERLKINPNDIQHYLGTIEQRIITGQTGARWQQRYVAKHNHDMNALTAAYSKQQWHGNPVHQWPV